MKNIKTYETYTTQQRLDDVLDKISKNGVDKLSSAEKNFLKSFKDDSSSLYHQKLSDYENKYSKIIGDTPYVDDNGNFKFVVSSVDGDGTFEIINGTLSLPDIEFDGGKTISGKNIEGTIYINIETDEVILDFNRQDYEAYDFAEGLEYELESFIDYVVDELSGDSDDGDDF